MINAVDANSPPHNSWRAAGVSRLILHEREASDCARRRAAELAELMGLTPHARQGVTLARAIQLDAAAVVDYSGERAD